MYSSYERERKIDDAIITILTGVVAIMMLPVLPVFLLCWLIGKAVQWCVDNICIS